jgi:malate permease and related proteins
MTPIVLLLVCFVLGVAVGAWAKPPRGLATSLNWWAINAAFPALILAIAPAIEFRSDLWFLPASMWGVLLGAWALFAVIGRARGWSRARIGALTLVCGLGNAALLGYPLVDALRGPQALKLAVVADQTGCFFALVVGGTFIAALYAGRAVTPSAVLRKICTFPPFIGLWVGVLAGTMGGWPDTVSDVLSRIGQTMSPIALFAVGLQLRVRVQRAHWLPIGLGLTWKLLLAPAIVWAAAFALGVDHEILAVAALQSAMAPMPTAAIVAANNDLEPELAVAVVGVGTLVSFGTVLMFHGLIG